jgi:hypothetical protein
VIVADHELDAIQPAFFQADQKFPPACRAFSIRQLNSEDGSSAVPVDPDHDRSRPAIAIEVVAKFVL